MPLTIPVNWRTVSRALGGKAGASTGYIFKSDGAGGGSMVPNTQTIPRRLSVGLSGDVDYTSIRDAINAAVVGGASAATPWEIKVYPGTYVELPMTLPPGVVVVSHNARIDTVFVEASNPVADLFTCTGGCVHGLVVSGVTDPTKCLFRCATPGETVSFEGVRIFNCSTGWHVSAGASVRQILCSVVVTSPGEEVGTFVRVEDAGSFLDAVDNVAICPSAAPFAGNPIQAVYSIDAAATANVFGGVYTVDPKDATADVFFCDDGAVAALNGVSITNSGNGLHIGSVGADTTIVAQGLFLDNNTLHALVESTTGKIFSISSADTTNSNLVAGSTLAAIAQYRDLGLFKIIGGAAYKYNISTPDLSLGTWFHEFSSTGVSDDGEVTDGGGLTVDVAAGTGWVSRSATADAFNVSWDAAPGVSLTASGTNYVYFDSTDSTVKASSAAPGDAGVLLATVVTGLTGIRFLHNTRTLMTEPTARLNAYLQATRHIVWKTGLGTAAGSTVRKFAVDSGAYYVNLTQIDVDGSLGGDATWSSFYGTAWATETSSVTDIDITNYDNAGALTAMTAGWYRADTLFITSDNRLSVVYGTAEYNTQGGAEAGATAIPASFAEPTACSLCLLVVQQGNGIVSIVDRRPQPGQTAYATSGGVTAHSALTGLGAPADDHTQYLLVSGARAMTGGLNMGGFAITNVGNVDGVDVSAHAGRHAPGAADPLATGVPVAVLVAAAATEGAAATFARSDHQHGIADGVPVDIATANSAGIASSVARSDHVHAHGAQTDGTLHAVAAPLGANGFMSGADKDKLDGIAAGATNTALAAIAPANVSRSAAAVGIGTTAARDDHKHDVDTASPDAGAVAVGNIAAEGLSTSLARADHTHAVARGTPVSVSDSNNAGVGTDFAAGDHVHAGLTRDPDDFSTFPAKATPASADILLVEDSAAAGVKKHVTVSSVASFGSSSSEATGTTLTASAVAADTLMSGMTLTPAAGTYLVWFTGDIATSTNGTVATMSVYSGGTLATSSERPFSRGAQAVTASFDAVARVTVNGAQAIEGRWRVTGGTGTNTRRSLAILRVS